MTDHGSTAGTLQRRADLALVALAVLFLALQLAWVPRPLGLSTDEATYLAKVDPRAPELNWTAPRAWGMPVLAAPVALFSASLEVVRTYMGVLSSVLLLAAFRPWVRVLHPAVAPIAALVFSTIWFTLQAGASVMPNLYVALGAVGAIGLYLRAVQHPAWWRTLLTGLAACLVALVRPTDSLLTLGPLVLCALLVPRLRRLAPLAAGAAGVLAGWSPWVVEAFLRFGDPVQRMSTAETAGPGGVSLRLANLLIYPRLLDGRPLYCCSRGPVSDAGPVPWGYTAWLLGVVALAVVGVLVAARRRHLPEVLPCAGAAVLVGGFYLLLPAFTSLRFLLPALALASIPLALTLVSAVLAARGRARPVVAAVVGLALLGHLGLMLPTAHHRLTTLGEGRAQQLRAAAALRPLVQGRPCLVVGTEKQVTAYYLRCRVVGAHPTGRPPSRVRDAEREGRVMVAVLSGRPPEGYLSAWERYEVEGMPARWRVYVPPR
ncbi:hypothetical protein GCM10009616_13330 [Microlunatus lacustris]